MTELISTKHAGLNVLRKNHTVGHSDNCSSVHKAVRTSRYQRLLIVTVIH